ncbi:hypothetical protein JTE90_014431 [Oedothorax gibbosus]|uniref:RING-type domain-containing protein n=1 Tax=Oedothorax gibbosus TaxID=931172 RepID=A0AAV6V3D4_9ARAC|nr:hypothetical protein JTE90_014431 [Oedothorax gibbosus]
MMGVGKNWNLRPSLPRRCKNNGSTTNTSIYVETECTIECRLCGTIVPDRNQNAIFGRFRRLPKSKTVKVTGSEVDCAICLNPLQYKRMLLLFCNHRFHKKCILRWFQVDKRCPICRK